MEAEHIPVDAYRLLRRLVAGGPQRLPLRTPDDEAASGYLTTWGLAEWDEDGDRLEATEAGRDVGRITRAGR